MTTRDTIEAYFDHLSGDGGWEAFLAPEMEFTSHTSPMKTARGRDAYLEATRRFYASIGSVQVRDLLVDGPHACAFTSYELNAPGGSTFTSDVAEQFTVADGRIVGLAIYFDSAPFPK